MTAATTLADPVATAADSPAADAPAAGAPAAAPPSVARRLCRAAILAPALVVLGIVLVSIAAPLLAPVDPNDLSGSAKNLPFGADSLRDTVAGAQHSVTHPLGTDRLGRDLLSRALYGGRISLLAALGVAVGAVSLGLVIGLTAGFFRRLDPIVMRILDGIMAIPAILLAIAVVAVAGPGLVTIILAATVAEMPGVARLVRAIVLRTREEPYVEAARSLGTPPLRILVRHILPSTLPPVAVLATYAAAVGVLVEAALSFLGLGIAPDIPSWGTMIADGRQLFRLHPQQILVPAAFLATLALAMNILGDGLRDEFDPRLAVRR